ncbi:MAG: serine-type D-Ala-D-Ala carboxypeptidase/endopeptidase [Solirubrobacteraceae bacterium]|nr:serine-type D-Ala-D-Ala carboxypeptidase/endopeptidase [Solirubrobacteraceae bacterium]
MTARHALLKNLRLGPALALSAVAAAGYGAEAQAAQAVSPDRTMQQLERIVHDRVDSGRSAGIVAGMVFPDGSTRVVAYGDAGGGRRLDKRSVFEIGSITKTFTATLLADMAQRGEVRLSDPVANLLPPGVTVPSRGGRQITLQDLATQTSGLPRLPTNLAITNPSNPYADYTVDQLYEFLNGYTLTRDPGSQFEYSNLGVGLLGHALALRAHKSYEELVRERILAPLHMTSSAITLTPEMARNFAAGHDADGAIVPPWDLPTLAGAGALRSSITDMLSYARANLDDDGGPLQLAMAIARSPRHRIDAQTQIGLNWLTQHSGDHDIVWHDGGTGGFSSFIGLDEARETAIVVLSNSSTPEGIDDIGFHLLDKRLALTPPSKHKEIKLPAQVLDRYVGVYDFAGLKVTITRSPRGLIAEIPGQGTARLYAESKTEFFLKVIDAQVSFQIDSKGRVTGAVLHQDGQTIPAERIG